MYVDVRVRSHGLTVKSLVAAVRFVYWGEIASQSLAFWQLRDARSDVLPPAVRSVIVPFFHLLSNSSKSLSVEFHGADVGCAFQAARQFCLDEAQLWQDGTYISTLRRQGANRDYFILFRENLPAGAGRLDREVPRGAAPAAPRELAA